MCYQITSGPSVSPARITGNGDVTVRIGIRSAAPARVKVSCDPGRLGPKQIRTVNVDGDQDVSFRLHLSGVAPGVFQINVTVEQSGCATEAHNATLTVLAPVPAGEA